MTIKEVTYFIAVCDGCKEDADYGDFTAWGDSSSAVEMAGDDWFERTKVVKEIPPCEDHPLGQKIIETVELLCPACQKCEICGESGYQMDDHLVCDEHEDHDFTDASALTETEWPNLNAVPASVFAVKDRNGFEWRRRSNGTFCGRAGCGNGHPDLGPFVADKER
ncbi:MULTISPECIES: hypothetical protein [Rhodococcus]|uniref:hypothetical protein n=1 Tax=Rhodococcus TaxID=1827 RepID=UPI0007DB3E8B|nr:MULTISPECIES: hypothetical protein [Rhodococcus]BCF84553.1 hypothetical protein RQCS_40980 [Rhodococcus qingshengii]